MSFSIRSSIKWLWILVIGACLLFYLFNPTSFSKESIAAFINKHHHYAWTIYFLIHILRGFVLLPSTPLIFAGVLLFPEKPFWVLTVSLIGIVSCSLLIYYFSDKLGFSTFFKKKSKKLELISEKLSGKHGYFYIMLWSFIPIVPTDLICYVSGALRIKLPVFLLSIFIGELILCSIYIFGGLTFLN